MAVIDDLPGVEVTVQVDGVALKEYEDKDEEEPDKTVSRYIEAVSGKEFSIKIEVGSDFKYKGDCITAWSYADGIKANGRVLRPKKPAFEVLGFCADQQIQKFRFNALETVSDGRMTSEEASKVQTLGVLEVRVYHTTEGGMKRGRNHCRDFTETGIVSEKALKGQTLSHSVGRGDTIAEKAGTIAAPVRYVDGYFNPAATFRFHYRSMEALKAMLIIPRTPTPPPLEDKDPADLTADDIKELLRRAKEAKELEDTKRKIKRERKDENSRPRKVSRPSAGDTQLELDDDGTVRESSTATLDREEQEIIELD